MIPVNDLLECDDLQSLVVKFEQAMKEAYDKHIPIIAKKVIKRPRKLWFNEELKEQKCRVREREAIYQKYRRNHQWTANKIE